jgi:hypothetical protein
MYVAPTTSGPLITERNVGLHSKVLNRHFISWQHLSDQLCNLKLEENHIYFHRSLNWRSVKQQPVRGEFISYENLKNFLTTKRVGEYF